MPTKRSRSKTSPLAPEISSCIGLLPRTCWTGFGGLGPVIGAIELMPQCSNNPFLLTPCVFLLPALLTGAAPRRAGLLADRPATITPGDGAPPRRWFPAPVLASARYADSIMLSLAFCWWNSKRNYEGH
jgi:hypothetical protein